MSGDEAIKSLELKLRAQQAEIKTTLNLDTGGRDVVELDQTRVGRLSRMDAMAQKEMSRATRARLQTELRRVDAAIARLESGRYGSCCRCHEAIEINRLQSDAAAPFCLSCIEEISEEREESQLRR